MPASPLARLSTAMARNTFIGHAFTEHLLLTWWLRASLVAQMVKNLPAMQETHCYPVQSLGKEGPLEKGMGRNTHSRILARGNPIDRGAWQAIVYGVPKSLTQLSD